MSKKAVPKTCVVSDVLRKLDQLDSQIEEVVKKLGYLKKTFKAIQEDPLEEICPDEIEANRATQDIIQEICLESLLDIEPKGDA